MRSSTFYGTDLLLCALKRSGNKQNFGDNPNLA